MNMQPTFNRVSNYRYQPPVAIVYGTDRGIQFRNVYKSLRSAEKAAAQFNGFVVRI